MKISTITSSFGTKNEIVQHYNNLATIHNNTIAAIKKVSERVLEEKCDDAEEYVEELYNLVGLPVEEEVTIKVRIKVPFGIIPTLEYIQDNDYNELYIKSYEQVEQ